jgi:hypothetical protein
VTLHNNLIANNSSGENGAGVRLRDVTATLTNNTTRSDSQPDSGVVDMGFHYPPFHPIFLPICIKQ